MLRGRKVGRAIGQVHVGRCRSPSDDLPPSKEGRCTFHLLSAPGLAYRVPMHSLNVHSMPCYDVPAASTLQSSHGCTSPCCNSITIQICDAVDIGKILCCVLQILPMDASPANPVAAVATLCLRTFAGLAAFESGRTQLDKRPDLLAEVVRATGFEHASSAVDAAIMTLAQAAASQRLQVNRCNCCEGFAAQVVRLSLVFLIFRRR